MRASALEYCRRSAMNLRRLSARRLCLNEMKNVQKNQEFHRPNLKYDANSRGPLAAELRFYTLQVQRAYARIRSIMR